MKTTTPQDQISAAARTLGRKGGKIGGKKKSPAKTASSRANGRKGGRPAQYFYADTITPERLRKAAAALQTAASVISSFARVAENGESEPEKVARSANRAILEALAAAKG